MTFREVLAQVIDWLQQDKRVSYRALKREFNLDDDFIEDLKEELLFSRHPVSDEDTRGLIWTGDVETIPNPSKFIHQEEESESRFYAVLPAVIAFLQREERVTYRTLKDVFGLNDGLLTEICEELHLRRVAIDEGGKVLVWTGKAQSNVPPATSESSQQVTLDVKEATSPVDASWSSLTNETQTQGNGLTASPERSRSTPEAENRQLTVVFCDLADSTKLSQQLDPEDLREVIRAYQEEAAAVIERYEGHIAQYLGDGLLIYMGWPQAHENDAERAVYTGLEIPQAIDKLNTRLETDYGVQLAVRIGIHTGPVVVGEMGGGDRHENLALGETPNISARLEGLAQPNTAVISPITAQLVQRSFVLEKLGLHELKGVAEPMMLYAVVGTRETDYDEHEGMLSGGFDALVGRDEEIGLLLRRWEQSKEGQGQVVLISGEAGLGKSSLVEGLRAHVHQEGYTRIAFRCSPYTTNSAMHPVIEHVQRVLGWQRDDSAEVRLDKLEQALQRTSLSAEETVPLFAALLSLPVSEDRYPALTLSPQRQRQLTQDALVTWMLEEAERQPVLAVWEDLHWADPSTLELLGLFIEQVPTVPMLNVLAYRPEFIPPWPTQSHMTPITLNRLERTHIEALVRRLAGGKMLPQEVVEHIVTKTDGVPLYVEELTKMLLESDLLEEESDQYILTGTLSSASIPATLQDSLMARLDRLPEVREVAQLGAVLGREFDYEMLQALNEIDGPTLQAGLSQLVSHELLYQRGRIPRAKYIFRHVLIRDAAYQSLLRRNRQQYHKQVAQLLEARFRDVVETQPELVAHHYTGAGLNEQAVIYWRRAGEYAAHRSAYAEAIAHLTQGLEVLSTLPEDCEPIQHELALQLSLGPALAASKGYTAPEVEHTYMRARELCQRLEDAPQRLQILRGLHVFYAARGQLHMAWELSEQLLSLAQQQPDTEWLVGAHSMMGQTLWFLGNPVAARDHLDQGRRFDDAPQHHFPNWSGVDPVLSRLVYGACVLWVLGYPDQAEQQTHEALTLAQALSHPYQRAYAANFAAWCHQFRRNSPAFLASAETSVALATEHGFEWLRWAATSIQGWGLAQQGHREDGIIWLRQGIDALAAAGAETCQSYFLVLLADAYRDAGDLDKGLAVLDEAVGVVEQNGERFWEAEVYRLRGELFRQADGGVQHPAWSPEVCFQKSLSIARHQQAKSLELRASTSLARLWQSQGKREEARELLSPVYSWFTEGFDTLDLIEAKTLLDELA